MDIRKWKVAELNRILPMVTETIKKEARLRQLGNEIEEKEDFLKEITKSIQYLKELPLLLSNVTEVTESFEQQISLLRQQQEDSKENLRTEIEACESEYERLTIEWKLETQLYRAILNVIATEGGFLLPEEIQEEFIKEYIYLLVFDNSFSNRFDIEKLIKGDKYKFYKNS